MTEKRTSLNKGKINSDYDKEYKKSKSTAYSKAKNKDEINSEKSSLWPRKSQMYSQEFKSKNSYHEYADNKPFSKKDTDRYEEKWQVDTKKNMSNKNTRTYIPQEEWDQLTLDEKKAILSKNKTSHNYAKSYTKPNFRYNSKNKKNEDSSSKHSTQRFGRSSQIDDKKYENRGNSYTNSSNKFFRQEKANDWQKENWDGKKNINNKTTRKYMPQEEWDKLTATERKTILSKGKTSSDYDKDYTKPKLRADLKEKIKDESKGGKSGQWSARKSQMLSKEYESKGGDYKHSGKKTSRQKSLNKWTKEDWQTSDKEKAVGDKSTKRYLPKDVWDKLSPSEKKQANESKTNLSRMGKQNVNNPASVKRKLKKFKEEK